MKQLIKKILKEQSESNKEKFIRYVASKLKPPYFKNINDLGVEKNEIKPILSLIFNQPIKINGTYVFNKKGGQLYYEDSFGDWTKYGYDEKNRHIYTEDSYNNWYKHRYDENGNEIYYETSNGFWEKKEYDENGCLIYYEHSNDGITLDKR
jgi:hypothetical protein